MIDERFLLHRFKATSHAAVVGAVLLAGFFYYDLMARELFRTDIAITLGAMAVTKLAAMLYYRRTE
jgi:hypothetical protein